ncbi:MAG: hypothetical protein WA441_11025 [Methyloceanibacter sp.]|jgi:uncharacterized membrane protein
MARFSSRNPDAEKAAALALLTRGLRPRWYSATAAVVAVGLALGYLSLQVRTLYHGPILTEGVNSNAEQYTYSAVCSPLA